MSVQKIIQESIGQNPLGLKEALVEELRSRVALALEAKIKEAEEDDEDEDEAELEEGLDFKNVTTRSGSQTNIFHNGTHVGTISKHFTKANPNGTHRIQYNANTIPAGSKGYHAHEGLASEDAAKKLVAKHFGA